jgi:glutathionylspermidine synthase
LNEANDLLDPLPLRVLDFDRLKEAARSITGIYRHALKYISFIPEDELIRLGIPTELASLSRYTSAADDLAFCRFDFIYTNEGIKVLDCNFDAPGLIVETFEINRLVCEEMRRGNPNDAGRASLIMGLARTVEKARNFMGMRREDCNVAICYRSDYSRDVDTGRYLASCLLSAVPTIRAVTIDDCKIDDMGLFDKSGRRIHVLIRLYPFLELARWRFSRDEAPEMNIDSHQLGRLWRNRKLLIINSPVTALLESKAMQAVIWKMKQEEIGLSAVQRDLVQKYMLPTSFDYNDFTGTVVAKPIFGRGGAGIKVFNGGRLIEIARTGGWEDELVVYQEYCEPPSGVVMTENGERRLRFIVSVWAINSNEIGVCYRAGEGITDAAWWVVPVYFADAEDIDLLHIRPHLRM